MSTTKKSSASTAVPAAKELAAKSDPTAKKPIAKPITVVKTAKKPPLKKPEVATAFENRSQNLAFSFAEMMKQRAREAEQTGQAADNGIKLSRRPTTRAKGQDTLQFPKADLDEFRRRLIILRQEAMGQSVNLKSTALEQNEERGSEDEDGSDAFLRLQDLKQVDSRNRTIQQIDEALARIADGTYGVCEVCGQLIRKPRLLNLPFVKTCMECQTEMESPSGAR